MNKQKYKDDRIEKPLTDNDFQVFLQELDKNDDMYHRDMTSNEIATIITNRLIKVSEKKKVLL